MGHSGVMAVQTASGAGHLFHICRVWGSRHGGSLYSERLVEELHTRGWQVTLLAERFENGLEPENCGTPLNQIPSSDFGVDQPAKAGTPGRGLTERIRLDAFFTRGLRSWPRRAAESLKILKRIAHTPGALVIVQGDVPRVLYLLLQLWVPLVFIRQDGILTCPGNNRFLRRSRTVCRKPLGWGCLRMNGKEGCMESLSWPHQIGRLAFRARDAVLLRCIRHFVGNSRYVLSVHRRAGFVLYPPRLTSPQMKESERDLHRLVFCGRLEESKGAADAVRILSLLPSGLYLEILGDGPQRDRLGQTVRDHQLENRVKFRGWVDSVTRDKILASARALLLPSLCDEAFGMAGLEALAQGTPVVAYDVGGVSEWCRDGAGLLVPCGDVRRAAMAVRELTEDPTRWANHSRAAKRVAQHEFAVDRFGRDLEELLSAECGVRNAELRKRD